MSDGKTPIERPDARKLVHLEGIVGEAYHLVHSVVHSPAAQALSLDSLQDRDTLMDLIRQELVGLK